MSEIDIYRPLLSTQAVEKLAQAACQDVVKAAEAPGFRDQAPDNGRTYIILDWTSALNSLIRGLFSDVVSNQFSI